MLHDMMPGRRTKTTAADDLVRILHVSGTLLLSNIHLEYTNDSSIVSGDTKLPQSINCFNPSVRSICVQTESSPELPADMVTTVCHIPRSHTP